MGIGSFMLPIPSSLEANPISIPVPPIDVSKVSTIEVLEDAKGTVALLFGESTGATIRIRKRDGAWISMGLPMGCRLGKFAMGSEEAIHGFCPQGGRIEHWRRMWDSTEDWAKQQSFPNAIPGARIRDALVSDSGAIVVVQSPLEAVESGLGTPIALFVYRSAKLGKSKWREVDRFSTALVEPAMTLAPNGEAVFWERPTYEAKLGGQSARSSYWALSLDGEMTQPVRLLDRAHANGGGISVRRDGERWLMAFRDTEAVAATLSPRFGVISNDSISKFSAGPVLGRNLVLCQSKSGMVSIIWIDTRYERRRGDRPWWKVVFELPWSDQYPGEGISTLFHRGFGSPASSLIPLSSKMGRVRSLAGSRSVVAWIESEKAFADPKAKPMEALRIVKFE